MAPIALTAVMSLRPGKEARFLEMFQKCADHTAKNEPFVLTYELSRGSAEPGGKLTEIIVREVYADKAGLDKHMAGEHVKKLIEAVSKEGLVTASKIVWQQPPSVGFASRL